MSLTMQPSASMNITEEAKRMRDKGIDVSILSIGDTHFSPPMPIIQSAQVACEKHTHYSSAHGLTELRSLISTHWFPVKIEASNICITPGVKQGLYYLLSVLPGKRVCVLEPAWLGYRASVILTNKEYISVNRYSEKWLDILQETQFDILIVCSPNNPDGYILTSRDQQALVQIATEKKAAIIVDEIYSKFQYSKAESSFTKYWDRYSSIHIIDGFSKAYAMTGLRLGFIATKNADVLSKCITMQEHIATCPSSIAQYAAVHFPLCDDQVAKFVEYYRKNRELVTEIFPEFKQFLPDGGFYYFVDLKEFGIDDASTFCDELLHAYHVAVVPGSAYGESFRSYVRISFSIESAELQKGLGRIRTALKAIN